MSNEKVNLLELKEVDLSQPRALDKIDILIGITGTVYIPERKELECENFQMVRPLSIVDKNIWTAEEVKEWIDCNLSFVILP